MWNGNSYPTTESPQRLTLLLQHGSILETGQRFKVGLTSTINSTPQYPLGPKTFGTPTMQQVLFSGQKTFYIKFEIPKNIKYELPHNHFRNLKHFHPFPCVGP
jgi:hypothetical protein